MNLVIDVNDGFLDNIVSNFFIFFIREVNDNVKELKL